MFRLDRQADLNYGTAMVDLKLQVPVTEEVKVDTQTLARIDQGIMDADEGRTVTIEESRKLVRQWISKFDSPKPR